VTAKQKDLTIVREVPSSPVVAWGEAHELFQVCANLVSNAMRYTPSGGTITVALAGRADDVELVVADTGIGISATDQQRLFDEFFRSTNPTALATPGTGLGLSIVHRIVERHHGRIAVESELGSGTTFRVTLPAETGRTPA
jgi:signal transduction histidine kinase